MSRTKPGCMEVLCTTNKCMVEENIIAELKEGAKTSLYTWTPANYTEFWGKTLEEAITGKLGTEKPNMPAMKVI